MTTKLELLQHLNTKSAFLNYPSSTSIKQPTSSNANILNRFFFETPKTKPKPFPKPPTSPTMTTASKTTPINMYNKISINKKSIELPRNSNLKFNKHIKASPSTSLNSNNNSQNTSKTITVNQSINFKETKSLTRSVSPVFTSPPMSAISVSKHKHKHSLYKKNTPLRQPPPTFLHITSKTPVNTVRSASSSTNRRISVNSIKSPKIQTRRKSNNNYKPLLKGSNCNNSNNHRYSAYNTKALRKSPSPISIAASSSTIRKQSHSPFHTEFPYVNNNKHTSKGNNSKTTHSNCNSACSSNKKCFKKIRTVSPLSAKTKPTSRITKSKSPTNNNNSHNKNSTNTNSSKNNIKVNQINNITVKDIKSGLAASTSRNDNFNSKQTKYSHLHHHNNQPHQHLQQHNPQQSSIISTICSNNSSNISLKKPNISVISKMGINSVYELPKQNNQDNYFITHYDDVQIHFIGVCDGHGTYGHLVSHFIKETLPQCMHREFLNKSTTTTTTNANNSGNTANINALHPSVIKRCIENAFVQTNSKLSNNASIDTNFSGSTCVSVVIANECIYTANVGDSRAIVCKQRCTSSGAVLWESEALTRDHKASEADESKRIERFGGRIEQYKDEHGVYIGPKRVWLKNDPVPGLAMTRSFGDQIASSVGVVSDPEIKERPLKDEDKVVVIASDGLWEYATNEDVCDIVKDVYASKSSDKICQSLYKAAYKKWKENDDSVDDITIIAMCFD